MRRALAAGLRALARHPALVLVLWAVNWLVSAVVVTPLLAALAADYERRPILAGAAQGDLAALGEVAAREASLLGATLWLGALLGGLYLLWSWIAAAGTIGAVTQRGFVATGSARGPASVRLGLCALVPYAAAAALGAALFALLRRLLVPVGLPLGTLLVRLLACALPGLLAWAVVTTAVDFARIRLCRELRPVAWRALLGALAELPTRRFALRWLHLVGYGTSWAAVLALQALAVRALGGAGSAPVAVYLLAQLGVMLRIALRVGTTAGQVALAGDAVI